MWSREEPPARCGPCTEAAPGSSLVRRARRAREGTCHTHGDVWLVSFSRDGTRQSARSLWEMSLHHEDSVRSDCAVVCFMVAILSVH